MKSLLVPTCVCLLMFLQFDAGISFADVPKKPGQVAHLGGQEFNELQVDIIGYGLGYQSGFKLGHACALKMHAFEDAKGHVDKSEMKKIQDTSIVAAQQNLARFEEQVPDQDLSGCFNDAFNDGQNLGRNDGEKEGRVDWNLMVQAKKEGSVLEPNIQAALALHLRLAAFDRAKIKGVSMTEAARLVDFQHTLNW